MVKTRTKNFDSEQLSEFDLHQKKYSKRFTSLLGLGIGMGVLAALLSLLVGGTPEVAEDISDTTENVASQVDEAGSNVGDTVGDAANGVAGTVGEAGSNVVDGSKDVTAKVGDSAKDLTSKAGELGSGVGDTVGDAANGVAGTVGEAGSNIVDGGKDVAAKVGDSAKDLTSKAGELGSGVVGTVGEAGSNIVDGGKNVAAKVGSAASGVGIGNALNAFQSGTWNVNQAIPLKIDDPIQFGYSSAVLTDEGKQVVSELAEEIKQLDAEQIAVKIVGHTSKTGNPDTNLLLSRQRANAVATELRDLGVKNNIDAEGKGYSEPMSDVPADDLRQQRTEVQLIRVK